MGRRASQTHSHTPAHTEMRPIAQQRRAILPSHKSLDTYLTHARDLPYSLRALDKSAPANLGICIEEDAQRSSRTAPLDHFTSVTRPLHCNGQSYSSAHRAAVQRTQPSPSLPAAAAAVPAA